MRRDDEVALVIVLGFEAKLVEWSLVVGEDTGLLELFLITFENIDGDQDGASGEFWGVVIQKPRVIENKLAELESHVDDNWFFIEV